ncbi:MAG: oligosaccharide flippase family protein [Saprospiraceae bacterium]|nr:oligosaccharide flippase family protein [Saprospiraceae bacterium]
MSIKEVWNKVMGEGHERTIKAKRNILQSMFYKALGILVGFAYFPISLSYLGEEKFGIFLVMISMVDWFSEFDIGIGNGLRNRLGEAMADKNDEAAKGFVSTAYFALGSIFSGIAIIAIGFSFIIPWAEWLGVDSTLDRQIMILAVMMFGAFAINFIGAMIHQIFYALQQTGIVNLFDLIVKLSFLFLIIILMYTTEESLILYGAAKTFTFAFIPLAIALYYFYFNKNLKKYKPSLSYVKRHYFDKMFSLGFQFFIIKISMIIIHQTNNILIAKFVSPKEVVTYEAAYKFLSIFLLVFVIFTNQLWSASVEAYRKGDLVWMKNTIKNVIKIWIGTVLITAVMVLVSPLFYKLWLGDKEIPMAVSIVVAISVSITNWVNLFNLIMNGTGKIRLQMYAWIFASIINIPLSIFFATTMEFGTVGIVLGTIVSMLPLMILSPIQVRKILSKNIKGIWNK